MKKLLFSLLSLLLATGVSSAFGARDHKAIAIVAEKHLTPKAAAAVREITGGEKMAVFACHPDKFREDYRIDGKKIWHTFSVGEDMKPDNLAENSLFSALEMGVNALKGDGYKKIADRDSVLIYFSYVVHFVADMHCPSHVKYSDADKPSPKKYTLGNKEIAFHKCWDTYFISEFFNVGCTDLAYLADIADAAEIARIQEGDWYDWALETARCCYDITREGEVNAAGVVPNDRQLIYKNAMFNKRQGMKAAYRLAAVLNAMFE